MWISMISVQNQFDFGWSSHIMSSNEDIYVTSDSFWEVDCFRRTVKRVEDGHHMCREMSKLIFERSEIEREYARKLQTWSKKWIETIDKGWFMPLQPCTMIHKNAKSRDWIWRLPRGLQIRLSHSNQYPSVLVWLTVFLDYLPELYIIYINGLDFLLASHLEFVLWCGVW